MTKHLGMRLHELLDGRLRPPQAAEAMAHLELCAECSEQYQSLREARERLNTSEAGIDMRFAQSLLDRDRIAQIASTESPRHVRVARSQNRRAPLVAATLAIAFVAIGLVSAYVAGAPQTVPANFADEAIFRKTAEPRFQGNQVVAQVTYPTSSEMRSTISRQWLMPDWSHGPLVPIDAREFSLSNGDRVLQMRMLVGMSEVVVVEAAGVLDASDIDPALRVDASGRSVYVLSANPAYVVWQSELFVVSAACSCNVEALAYVIEAFPLADSVSVADRIRNGTREFADALSGK